MNTKFLAGAAVGLVASCAAYSAAAVMIAPDKSYAELSEAKQQSRLQALAAAAAAHHPVWPNQSVRTTGNAQTDTITQRVEIEPPMKDVARWMSEAFADEQLADHCRWAQTRGWVQQGLTNRVVVQSGGEVLAELVATRDACAAVSDVRAVPGYPSMSEAEQSDFLRLVAEGLKANTQSMPMVESVHVRTDAQTDRISVTGRMSRALNAKQLVAIRSKLAEGKDSTAACADPTLVRFAAEGISIDIKVTDRRRQTLIAFDCPA